MKEIDINNKEQILNECDFNYYNKSECSRELCRFYNDIFLFNHNQALVDLGRIAITLNNQSKQIEDLKQQLAEKEKEIDELKAYKKGAYLQQQIFDFAVEQLTEIRDYVKECNSLDMVEGKIRLDIAKKIRLKINQLKEMK